MSNIRLISSGENVWPLSFELRRNPQLWDEYQERTNSPDSPHRDMSDIWVRYNPRENCIDRESAQSPHDSVWYPSVSVLPQAKSIALRVMTLVQGERLGGVLITKLPPGTQCFPHIDGGWHAEYYDKYAVQIESHIDQSFNFEGESLVSKPGDIYWFDNSKEHWVINNSNVDRITMIVCVRSHRYERQR